MKNYFQVIFMLFIVAFSMPVAFSEAEEFDFKLEFDHDFDDDEQIECDITYDDTEKTYRFDEDDSGDKLIYEKSFNFDFELDCDENVDDITLHIFDQTGKKVFDEDYSRENRIKVDLDDFAYDEDENWFSIEITHDYGNDEIDCELDIDGTDYDFSFDSDDSSDVLTIEKNYEDVIKFTCDEEMDEIKLTVYDDDNEEQFKETYLEDDRISYDRNKEEMDPTEIIIDMDHDFGNDEIVCDLEIDGDDYATYTFDEDSTSSDLKIAVDIKEEIVYDCDDKFDDIVVRIYDSEGNKIDTLEYSNEDEFEYILSGGVYDYTVKINNVFAVDEEVDCDVFTDSKKLKELTLDDGSRIGDLMFDGSFNSEVRIECDGELDSIEFATYFDQSSKVLFEEVYSSAAGVNYTQLSVTEQKVEDDKITAQIAEEERRVAAEKAAAVQAEQLRVAEQKIADQKAEQAKVAAAELARLEALKVSESDNLNSGSSVDSLTGKVVGSVSEEVIDLGDSSSSTDLYWKIAAGVAVVLIALAVFAFVEVKPSSAKSTKKPVKASHGFRHEPSRKVEQRTSTTSNNRNKVNFDFLDKRK